MHVPEKDADVSMQPMSKKISRYCKQPILCMVIYTCAPSVWMYHIVRHCLCMENKSWLKCALQFDLLMAS